MDALLPSHPETNRALINHSLRIYKLSFRKVFGLALLLSVIVFLPHLIENVTSINLFQVTQGNLLRIAMLLIDLVSVLVFISILWRVYHIIHRHKESVKADIKLGLKKVLAAFIATILQAIILVFVVCLLFAIEYFLLKNNLLFHDTILGISFTVTIFVGQFFLVLYTYTLIIFLVPLIALENKSIWSSIKHNVLLVWDHWWRTFSLQITPWICFVLTLMAFRFIFGIDVSIYLFENRDQSIWDTILQIFIFALFVPWVAAIILVQLRDLELRKHISKKDKNAIH